MNQNCTLIQAHPKLQTKEGFREMMYREVVTSSKIEGVNNAKAVLDKSRKTESSAHQRSVKKSSHKRPI
jgi:hypothetical protein